jgi:hypothetical protein
MRNHVFQDSLNGRGNRVKTISLIQQFTYRFLLGTIITLMLAIESQANLLPITSASLNVYNSSIGLSTFYIGACEGDMDFRREDFIDLQINTYRIYGGMSRWETEDDDGIYGYPSINQIKANPDLINWDWWDQVMSSPEGGSEYHFSGTPEERWQGNARTIFETLNDLKVRPVITIRNSDPDRNPGWALQLNPPRTEADWNEWWEHVFATVYWLNVRNNYHVDDWEVHNEPDNLSQGWGGNQDDYAELIRVTSDAIAYVYDAYLPDRTYHIHAPKTLGGSSWPEEVFATVPDDFDSVNVHNYDLDISSYVRQVRQWMQASNHAHSPLWLGEWGTYTTGYEDFEFSLTLIKNLIRMAQPGDTHVNGSHIFSLYDWGSYPYFEGLIEADGNRRLSYYAFRMGIRALQGGKSVLLTALSEPQNNDLMAIATQEPDEAIYHLLLVNSSAHEEWLSVDWSNLLSTGQATIREFSEAVHDEVIDEFSVTNGELERSLPPQTAWMITVMPAELR